MDTVNLCWIIHARQKPLDRFFEPDRVYPWVLPNSLSKPVRPPMARVLPRAAPKPVHAHDQLSCGNLKRSKTPWYIGSMTTDTPAAPAPVQLSDRELLTEIHHAARSERGATTHLIALLMELDSRRLYLREGYSSMFTYCTQALRLSEHAHATGSRRRVWRNGFR